ncbi:MAG: response regulator [Acidobacteriota bacterium]|jgi:DNA-binding NtrC family response regulator|nr:response regulator [Acidobacteriota bacterium]
MASRILIADDEEAFLRPTSLYLEKHGYLCDCVRSGEDAAAALEKTAYDLLIVDINMPGNQNLEFLRSRTPDSRFLPVIVVTGYPSLNSAVESLRLSVVDYRIKPLDLPSFVEAVKTSLDKGKVIRAMREARQGFGNWLDQVSRMESAFLATAPDASVQPGSTGSLDWYLNEAIQRFANLSMSLMKTVQTLKEGLPEGKTDVCSLMHCSRLAAYEDVIRETVDVLIRTKNSFKSKELAEIRKKLECVLKNKPGIGE